MAYNLTAFEAANTTTAVFSTVNDVTGGWWSRLLIIGLWVAISIPIMIKTGETLKALIAGSFVTSVLSVLAYGLDWVGYKEPVFSLVILSSLVVVLLLGGLD